MSRVVGGIEDAEQWLENCPNRVWANWQAAHAVEPFGGEQQLLARIASLLYLIASKGTKLESVCEASDVIMRYLMPPDWIGHQQANDAGPTDVETIKKNLKAMQAAAEKVFS